MLRAGNKIMSIFRSIIKKSFVLSGSSAVIRRHQGDFGTAQYHLLRRDVFERLGIDVVIDVGANSGQYGSELRRFFKEKIISFEPTSSAFKMLERSAKGDPSWKVEKLALGSKEAKQMINVACHSVFSSFLELSEYASVRFGNQSIATTKEEVYVCRLDDILPTLLPEWRTKKIFLKMDTQGFDLEVFKGAKGVLDRVMALQTEVSVMPIYEGMPHWTESISYIEKYGFTVAGLFAVNIDENKVIEFDCLMVRG